MKKLCVLTLCFLVLFNMFPSTAYALSVEQTEVIQQLLDDTVRISGTPGISVAVVSDNQTYYFNSGHTSSNNSKNPPTVDAHTLYEIGSLSKAFTAFGILLLEEQGLLSTTDRIEDHLPWFYVTYQNETPVVTIKDLLNHTSGLAKLHSDAPRGEGADMLLKTVEPFVGATLDFAPGTSYAYNNTNYNILGLIIEAVSGQSYEAFMKEQVFEPLGLHETFVYHSEAIATGRMAQGHRHVFFNTFTYDAPIYGGMKPAGFVISSSYDMARWINIHLGLVQDIPEIFSRVIKKAHQADISGPSMGNNNYYSNGWIIETDSGILGHAGQTPSFMSNMLLFTEQKQGVIFLANGGNVNNGLAWGIKYVLDGDLQQKYVMSARQKIDTVLSAFIILLSILSIKNIILSILNRKKYKPQLTKGKIIITSLWAIVAIFMFVQLLTYPNAVGSGWAYIFDWNPPNTTFLLFILPIYFAISAWYTYTKKPKMRSPRNSLKEIVGRN